jgi:putative ABC transport system substrate-binding protein
VLAIVLATATVRAQRIPRVGYLGLGKPGPSLVGEAFHEGLRDLGYVAGKTINVDIRLADGDEARLRAFASELARQKVDVIVAAGSPAIRAALDATKQIPIVMAVSGDPLAAGFIASYGRPGGNVTGLSSVSPELSGKRLQLLTEIVRGLARVALVSNPDSPENAPERQSLQAAARAMNVQLQLVEVRSPAELEAAFARIARTQVQALVFLGDAFTFAHRARIIELAAKSQLPAIFPSKEFVEAGGLVAYGPSLPDLFRRAAYYVDRILKGAAPASLPVEQPAKFELVVNRRTELLLDVTIPSALLMRADEVIE